MGLRISTNTQSLAAQRNLGVNGAAQKASLEKLASGSRIVRSADDAAGLAISENLKAQVRSTRQDIRNANDGISMIQTAEGGMNEIGNILIRFRELSIQGATDTLGDPERRFIDKEVQQLKSEIDRIADSTEFNGKKLLQGYTKEQRQAVEDGEAPLPTTDFQIGMRNDPKLDRIQYDTGKLASSTEALGVRDISVQDKKSAQDNLAHIDGAIMQLNENRSELGALQNRLQSTVSNLTIYDENISAANSRIRDVDMASETAELTKNNILTSAGVAVLSQANQNNMQALKLI